MLGPSPLALEVLLGLEVLLPGVLPPAVEFSLEVGAGLYVLHFHDIPVRSIFAHY
jgi:hypothetical protein